MILRAVEPEYARRSVRQINLDECNGEYAELRRGGRYADELVILPDESIIVVEHANRPSSHEGKQVLETFKKLIRKRKKVVAIVVVAKRGFDKRDYGLLAQALRSEGSKHGVCIYLKGLGQALTIRSIRFVIRN